MQHEFQVEWTEQARSDLYEIAEFIAEDSASRAWDFLELIEGTASELHQFPLRGRVVRELRELTIWQWRELVVSPWRIIYKIVDQTVYVSAMFDSRRNLEDVLTERFKP